MDNDYRDSQRESQTEREHDEWEQLGEEDTTQETMNAIYDEQEKDTDY